LKPSVEPVAPRVYAASVPPVATRTFFTPSCDSLVPSAVMAFEIARERGVSAQFENPLDGALLSRIFDQCAVCTYLPAERDDPAEIALALIGFHIPNSFTASIPLRLRHG
jgi:hypothetical protein